MRWPRSLRSLAMTSVVVQFVVRPWFTCVSPEMIILYKEGLPSFFLGHDVEMAFFTVAEEEDGEEGTDPFFGHQAEHVVDAAEAFALHADDDIAPTEAAAVGRAAIGEVEHKDAAFLRRKAPSRLGSSFVLLSVTVFFYVRKGQPHIGCMFIQTTSDG